MVLFQLRRAPKVSVARRKVFALGNQLPRAP
jgi:hypothetical protein